MIALMKKKKGITLFICLMAIVIFLILYRTEMVTFLYDIGLYRPSGTYLHTIEHTSKDIYTKEYQQEADKALSEWKKAKDYTIEDPLLVRNPYGTNTTSVYYYAQTNELSYVKCTIKVKKAEKITHILKNDGEKNVTLQHEYLITGLAAGFKNEIKMDFYDYNNEKLDSYSFDVELEKDEEIPAITKIEDGSSKQKISEGLFAILGHDKSKAANIYFFDNNGMNRGKIPLNGYRSDRILMIGENLVYSCDIDQLAVVNRFGKVEKTISLGKYRLHHDFMYDETTNKLLCLVNDTKKDTIEDIVISVDLDSGKIEKLVDFEILLQDMRDISVQRKGGKNTYGGTELDWLHLNSLDVLSKGEIIVSSREESSIIKVSHIYQKPKLSYIIHSGSLYKGTKYEKKLLKQIGTFVGHAGQHTITIEKNSSLKDGQYYLYMYNNNFGKSATLPFFDWSLYPGTGSYQEGKASYFYKYLIDEKKKTYQLEQKFSVPYSSVVSGVQYYQNHITFSSGMSHCYGEYDKKGEMIRTFTYESEKYAYRVLKYDFMGFYYIL